jgi:hypothetical protein
VEWIHLAQNKYHLQNLMNIVMKIGIPKKKKAGNFLTICVTIRFSRRILFHRILVSWLVSYTCLSKDWITGIPSTSGETVPLFFTTI